MTDEELQALIDADDLGFLDVKPKGASQASVDERVMELYQPIAEFVRTKEFPPEINSEDPAERRLASQLQGLRNDEQCRTMLKEIDELGLFDEVPQKPLLEANDQPAVDVCGPGDSAAPQSIDDILNDPSVSALLGGSEEAAAIFDLKHVPAPSEVESPDHVAQRTPCDDFVEFAPLLKECQDDLREKRRRLLPFANEQNIEAGHFYVLRGVLLYVAEVGIRERSEDGKTNARLRCIFENGTESDMLLRSLARELYKDGRRVTLKDEETLDDFFVDDEDRSSGFIYVLRSQSSDPQISGIPNLYKIGLASGSVESRIKNARHEPTYLMSNVEIVASFEVFNVNLQKLELLIHRFFDQVAVKVQVTDAAGNYHSPKEWFSVPLDHVRRAIELLISGDILRFKYDSEHGIVERKDGD